MTDNPLEALRQQVESARADHDCLAIEAGNSKRFLGREISGKAISVAAYSGIVEYDPRELVITAKAGTTLHEIGSVLAEHRQMLSFEPPAFNPQATLGGTLAAGLSGPARPFAGSARDLVLGTSIINGRAEVLHFGGKVMKNVAGYDLSRLMVGSMGTLGLILQASLKVLPIPETEMTRVLEMDEAEAITQMNRLAATQSRLSAAACYRGRLYLRFSGVSSALKVIGAKIGGETVSNGFWTDLRDHRHEFFSSDKPLWRLALAPAQAPLALQGESFIDWCGAQRWYIGNEPADVIRQKVRAAGGHATLFRHGDRQGDIYHPLSDAMMAVHLQLKKALDPDNIFNPGRLYPAF